MNSSRLPPSVRGYLADLSKHKELQLADVHAEMGKLQTCGEAYEAAYRKALDTPAVQAKLNRILMDTERELAPDTGLPGRPWYKHQLMAPGSYTGYSAKTLPGIREAAEAHRWTEANEQAKRVAAALRDLRLKVEAASALLSQ